MNLIFVLAGTLLFPVSENVKPDTIILNAGNDSKVIFYGKTADDLKKLEGLDLNKIMKDLNERQAGFDTQKQFVKLEDEIFTKEPETPEPSRIQKYMSNTFLNLYIARGRDVNRYVFFKPTQAVLQHPTAELTSQLVVQNKLTTNLSLVHDYKLIEQPRYAVSLRYGIGLGFSINRYLHWNLLNNVADPISDEVVEHTYELLTKNQIVASQSDFNAFQTYLQLAPKFNFKNAQGKSTFYFTAGARLNYNRLFENVNPVGYSNVLSVNASRGGTVKQNGAVISGGGYGIYSKNSNFGVSYLAEIGYKAVGLFVNYYPGFIPLDTRLVTGKGSPDSGFKQGQSGKIGYITFGVKLGR